MIKCNNCHNTINAGNSMCPFCGSAVDTNNKTSVKTAEFGIQTHAFFWFFVILVSVIEAGITYGFFQFEIGHQIGSEGKYWITAFGFVPALFLFLSVLWSPRKGKYSSMMFLIIPGLFTLAAMTVVGAMNDFDMVGYGACVVGASVAYYLLGALLHRWIVYIRRD
jgi:hypothetical protein